MMPKIDISGSSVDSIFEWIKLGSIILGLSGPTMSKKEDYIHFLVKDRKNIWKQKFVVNIILFGNASIQKCVLYVRAYC